MRWLVLVLAAMVVAACGDAGERSDAGLSVAEVRLESGDARLVIRAEIADTDEARVRGLMGRRTLASDTGMLFVWDEAEPRGFWMKDTLIPLDLIAIRAGRVVGIYRLEPCAADPCPITRTEAADAALEVAAGVPARAGIRVGASADSEAIR